MKSIRSRSSHRRCSVRKGVLRNFIKVAGKHLRQSFFFNKETFFTEHLWATASADPYMKSSYSHENTLIEISLGKLDKTEQESNINKI